MPCGKLAVHVGEQSIPGGSLAIVPEPGEGGATVIRNIAAVGWDEDATEPPPHAGKVKPVRTTTVAPLSALRFEIRNFHDPNANILSTSPQRREPIRCLLLAGSYGPERLFIHAKGYLPTPKQIEGGLPLDRVPIKALLDISFSWLRWDDSLAKYGHPNELRFGT